MGAEQFCTRASGKNAQEAFKNAVENARYEYGHRGYTGTIAEKSSFKMVTPNPAEAPKDCVDRCLDDDNHFCQDKGGPAACVEIGPNQKKAGENTYCFFGWASS